MENINHIKDRLSLIECDITDSNGVQSIFEKVEPDIIHHLAAQSFVPTSFRCPQSTIDTNVIGTLNILEGVIKCEIDPIIQIAGSSEEYGLVYPNEVPIKETNPLRPLSPYGVSKVACDLLSIQYYHSYGLKVVVTRAFNHFGVRRGDVFVCSNFAKQIAMIEKGKRDKLFHGNLEAQRDFTDVRDIIRAYYLAVHKKQCIGKQLNISSGTSYSIRTILNYLISLAKVEIKTELDPSRSRPSDVPILLGDSSLFRKITGWCPSIEITQTLKDLLNYWRNRCDG